MLTENMADPTLWREKWVQFKEDPCPVRLVEHDGNTVQDWPMNSDIPTRCNHWLGVGCWEEIAHRDEIVRCPLCREDVTEFAERHRED